MFCNPVCGCRYRMVKMLLRLIKDNDEIEKELQLTEEAIAKLEQQKNEVYQKFMAENLAIIKLNENLENIRVDIINNKDAKKLRDLGAEMESLTLKDICPVCHQKIQDALFLTF